VGSEFAEGKRELGPSCGLYAREGGRGGIQIYGSSQNKGKLKKQPAQKLRNSTPQGVSGGPLKWYKRGGYRETNNANCGTNQRDSTPRLQRWCFKKSREEKRKGRGKGRMIDRNKRCFLCQRKQ